MTTEPQKPLIENVSHHGPKQLSSIALFCRVFVAVCCATSMLWLAANGMSHTNMHFGAALPVFAFLTGIIPGLITRRLYWAGPVSLLVIECVLATIMAGAYALILIGVILFHFMIASGGALAAAIIVYASPKFTAMGAPPRNHQ